METLILRKKGSPHKVRISPDPKDSHFALVQLLKISTGEQKGWHFILASDVPQWRSMYERDGFCVLKEREVTNV